MPPDLQSRVGKRGREEEDMGQGGAAGEGKGELSCTLFWGGRGRQDNAVWLARWE